MYLEVSHKILKRRFLIYGDPLYACIWKSPIRFLKGGYMQSSLCMFMEVTHTIIKRWLLMHGDPLYVCIWNSSIDSQNMVTCTLWSFLFIWKSRNTTYKNLLGSHDDTQYNWKTCPLPPLQIILLAIFINAMKDLYPIRNYVFTKTLANGKQGKNVKEVTEKLK